MSALAEGYLPPRAIAAEEASEGGRIMLYVRTAAGNFINAAEITQFTPQRAGSDNEITGWVAICDGGKAVTLSPYYAEPGRIEAVRDYMPASAGADGKLASEIALPCSSAGCPCA